MYFNTQEVSTSIIISIFQMRKPAQRHSIICLKSLVSGGIGI